MLNIIVLFSEIWIHLNSDVSDLPDVICPVYGPTGAAWQCGPIWQAGLCSYFSE
jgi:hypothetical protein